LLSRLVHQNLKLKRGHQR